jgi:hypothetical protein
MCCKKEKYFHRNIEKLQHKEDKVMNKKALCLKLYTLLLCSSLLISCTGNSITSEKDKLPEATSTKAPAESIAVTSNPASIDMVKYDEDDRLSSWEDRNANYIMLNGKSAELKGSGVKIDGSKLTITDAGTYVLTGKLDNGQIVVNSENKGVVRLVLNGTEINCTDNAPIYIKKAGKTIITLQDGTQNLITDGANYVMSDAQSDEPSAAIFSKDDLTINGNGTLTVKANYKDGICSKDDLKIMSGNINVTSTDDGFVGRDMIAVNGGNLTIKAGGDGLKSTNDTKADKGIIVIENGNFDITAGADGIQAESSMLIVDGDFKITTNGGSANGVTKAREEMGGRWGMQRDNTTTSNDSESKSAKGIKASLDITICGGKLSIDSSDDAIHSNVSVNIANADITISSGDDGIHADSSIEIGSGNINIVKSYEGIESALITINDGKINIVSSDDGINIAGGNDGSSMNGRPGQNNFAASGNYKLNINGGYVSVDAGGDGLDSNGSIYMTAGTVIVNGPTNSGNGALDYDGIFEITGGTLIAAGSSGMAQAPSDSSTQASVSMTFSTTQQAGTLINLQDSKGNTIVTFAPKKKYQSVVISTPAIKMNTAYSIFSGGSSTGNEVDGLYTDGAYNGTKIVDFTISKITTWMSESGEITGGNGFGPGGMRGPRGQGGPGGMSRPR